MPKNRVGLAGMLSLAALLAAGAAHAQSAPAPEIIQMGPGVVLVVPAGTVTAPSAMPDPAAMIHQMDAQIAQMNALMQATLQYAASMPLAMPAVNGSVSSVVVTSFSDGAHSCTERVVYPGNGAAEQMQVSETGNACGSLGMTPGAEPASAPTRATPLPVTSPAIHNAPPLVVADND